MKNTRTYLAMVAIFGLVLAGCTDKAEETFTTLTVEQNKENIVEEGNNLIVQLDGLKDVEAVFAMQDLVYLAENSSQTMNSAFNATKTIDYIANLDKSTEGLFKLRSTDAVYQTLPDLFDENAGVYTYNRNTREFDKTVSSSEITFKFPTGSSLTNNATLTLDNFSSKVATNVDFEGTNLIESLDIVLKDGSTTLFSLEVEGEYNSDDIPTSLSEILTFNGTYVFSNSLTNNSSKITYDFSFKNGSTKLMIAHYESIGNYDYDNLSTIGDMQNEAEITEFLKTANAYIQIGNLKLQGVVDFETLYDKMDETFPEGVGSSEADNANAAEIANQYSKLYLKYADNDNIIAKNTFYANPYQSYYNEIDGYTLGNKFVFKDGSAMDGSFFEEGFDQLSENFHTFQIEMGESYRGQ